MTRSAATAGVLEALREELGHLQQDSSIATTLLIHPAALTDFLAFNDFLGDADCLLRDKGLEGVYQIASFHPYYRFADTSPDDVENYTNRSPWPMLHLLREDRVSAAVEQHPDVAAIPQRNIDRLRRLGADAMRSRLRECLASAQQKSRDRR